MHDILKQLEKLTTFDLVWTLFQVFAQFAVPSPHTNSSHDQQQQQTDIESEIHFHQWNWNRNNAWMF